MRTLQQLKRKNPYSVFDREVLEFEDLRKSTTYKYPVVGAEVGDSKETVFYPQVKMMKWDNECNFSLRFLYPVDGFVEQVSNTIYWKSADKKVEAVFYDIAPCRSIYYVFGGFEFEVIFNEKPISNKVEFSIQSKNLNFYKQVKLDDPTTSCNDIIIDSYAVYHSSKKNNKYTTGKAFQIYRSFVYDSNGRQEYCDMNIGDEILTITIPQDFIDNAVYPIHLDPTVGNTNIGARRQIFEHHSAIAVSSGTPMGVNPQAITVSAFACWQTRYGEENFYGTNAKMALWVKATGEFIAQSFPEGDKEWEQLPNYPDPSTVEIYYDIVGQNGAKKVDLEPLHTKDDPHLHGNQYDYNFEREFLPNYVSGGFQVPEHWYTQHLLPQDKSKGWGELSMADYLDGTGEEGAANPTFASNALYAGDFTQGLKWLQGSGSSEHQVTDPQGVGKYDTLGVPIDNIEYYIGCIFNNPQNFFYYTVTDPATGETYKREVMNYSQYNQYSNIIMFDLCPGEGNGCETGGDYTDPSEHHNSFVSIGGGRGLPLGTNPTLDNPGYGGSKMMYYYPTDLQRVPIGGGQWEDRNYSVYLDYTSSTSSSTSQSSSSTSTSSSSSGSFKTETLGENSGDDYSNVTRDTYLREDFPTRNYGYSVSLAVISNQYNVGKDKNILIRIDYTQLPVGANILFAELYVKTGYLGQGNDNRDFISAYKMLKDWNEGEEDNYPPSASSDDPTWSHRRYSTSDWALSGANGIAPLPNPDHAPSAADTTYIVQREIHLQEQWYSFDVTSEVIEQIAGSNFGFILKGSGDGFGGDISIVSSEGEDGSRPYLYIRYS